MSIAFIGCARHFRAAGAPNWRLPTPTEPYVRPLTRALQSEIFMPCDVAAPGQLEAVYGASLRTGGASISCNTLSLTPARKI